MKDKILHQLNALYAQIPSVKCKGLCQEACGPIGMQKGEAERIEKRAGEVCGSSADLTCPLLKDGRCSVYDIRPAVCFLPETWVFTAEGPKHIKDILAGDLVYGGNGKLCRVIATRSKQYNGKICNIRHSGTHIECWSTADHEWLCVTQKDKRSKPKTYWKQAENLQPKYQHKEGDYLCFPLEFEDVPDLKSFEAKTFICGEVTGDKLLPFTSGRMLEGKTAQAIPAVFDVSDDFLFMLGMYLAEGSASFQSASFTTNIGKKPNLERISAYLETLSIRSKISQKRNIAILSVNSCLFARLVTELAGRLATNKAINDRLFSVLSHQQKWSVYEGWNAGDGRKCIREKEFSTTTSSEKLAAQMTFTALANKLFPRIYIYRNRKREGSPDNFDVHLFPSNFRETKPGYGTRNMFDNERVYSPVKELEERYYTGPVIDIQVENAESFVTSSGIAHNCRLWGAVETMKCPHGCKPVRYLTETEAQDLLARVGRLCGDGAFRFTFSPEQIAQYYERESRKSAPVQIERKAKEAS